jgi:hypothetical protein
MSIAQRFVAGEGISHPQEPAPQPDTTRSLSSKQPLSCDRRNLPYAVLRAQQHALTAMWLPQRARLALSSIALTLSVKRPLASIFASRRYLTTRIGMAERTWYRAEQDLVQAGLITVADQGRKARGGEFGAAYIHITRACAVLLGLVADDQKAVVETAEKTSEATASTLPSPSLAAPTATVADRFTNKVYLSPVDQERQPGQVPADLERLMTVGFGKNYIFKLMKQARVVHRKRLSDVVEACWDQIRRARLPIPYLQKLLESTTDFAWLAKQKLERTETESKSKARATQLTALRRFAAGKTFFAANGMKRMDVSPDGSTVTVHDASEPGPRVAPANWASWFADGLETGQIVDGGADISARFDQRRSNFDGKNTGQQPTPEIPRRARTPVISASIAAMRSIISSSGSVRQ